METLTGYLRRVLRPANPNATDETLLAAFVNERDADAFAELMERHAGMVWSACRRVLINPTDAEDAFQATFLVLSKKADSVHPRRMLAGWLHGVAVNVSIKLRAKVMRRATRERASESLDVPNRISEIVPADDLKRLDEAIAKLPSFLRDPLILCELEGRTRNEVAKTLNIPPGTVASRVARAKQRLAKSIGIPALTASVWNGWSEPARASMNLIANTAEAAVRFSTAAPAAATATVLAREVLFEMLLRKLKFLAVLAIGTTALLIGAGSRLEQPAQADTPKQVASVRISNAAARVLRPTDDVNYQLLKSAAVRKDLGLSEKESTAVTEALAKADALWKEKAGGGVFAMGRGAIQVNGVPALPAAPPVPVAGRAIQVVPAVPAAPGAPLPPAIPPMVAGNVVAGNMAITRSVDEVTPSEIYGENTEFGKSMKSILNAGQIHRLRQLELTSNGPSAFINRRVVRYLALTEEQEDAVEEVLKKWKSESRRLIFKPKEQSERQDTAFVTCVKLLTGEQKAKWDQLVGKSIPAFDLLPGPPAQPVSGVTISP